MAQQPPAMQPSNMQIPQQPQTEVPPNSYYPEPPNDLTGGLPINLDSLRDGPPGSKPFYPYSTLIRYASFLSFCVFFYLLCSLVTRYAIKGSPNQKLLLEDIYYAIESRVRVPSAELLSVLISAFSIVSVLQKCAARVEGEYLFLVFVDAKKTASVS